MKTKLTLTILAAILGLAIAPLAHADVCTRAVAAKYHTPSKMALDVCESVRQYAKRYSVPESLAVAVASHESTFYPWAHSGAGAVGPMQVIPRYHCPKYGRGYADQVAAVRRGLR